MKLMVPGADWYPISQCANFLIDRYASWDATLRKFFLQLGLDEERARKFIVEQRMYLGNVLLCYRTGYDRTGTKNLSPRSFDNCAEHLRRHIDAVAPEILVTFGGNGARRRVLGRRQRRGTRTRWPAELRALTPRACRRWRPPR
ncbi:MAG: hypothetical protein IPL61_06920 [Myxococcales bacterium]|nr:hypothetical protein [Myxococcales bacterium]